MNGIEAHLWWIILMPLAGAIVNGLFGKRLGKGNVAFIAISLLSTSFLVSLAAFAEVALVEKPLHLLGEPWFQVGRLTVSFGLLVDRLSATLMLVVTGVGLLIQIYSASYMWGEDEPGYARFFAYLNLFIAAMLILVMGDSLLLTFIGWEGVGLCSYLLIAFWYTESEKALAGRKAFVVNRIGDFGLLVGIFSLLSIFGTPSYTELATQIGAFTLQTPIQGGVFDGLTAQTAFTFTAIALFVGCAGKSAQLPLYIWLPDAMAGPTPVSALIHAATMVTAGVYLVARTSFLFTLAPAAAATVTLVGAATALFAALIAFTQNDIKKVLAYSTISQLGFMFIGVGAGVFYAGVLHLVTHAFFKACLFLGAGSVMHGMCEDTDIRHMGGLAKKMPHTARTFLVATLAITGIVPLSGFFSKDAILAGAFFSQNASALWVGKTAYALGTLAALGTAFYMVRLYLLTFGGTARSTAAEHAHESSPVMTAPLWVLAFLSVASLAIALPAFPILGAAGERFGHFLGAPEQAAHVWPFAVALAVALTGGAVAWTLYAGRHRELPARLAARFGRTYRFTCDKFRVDELYDLAIVRPLKGLAHGLWRTVDGFLIEGLIVNGIPRSLMLLSRILRKVQNGDVQRYAAFIAIVSAAVLWFILSGGGR